LAPVSQRNTIAADQSSQPVQLTINGKAYEIAIRPWVTLLDALRERLHLTGTKVGCNHGQCGACTVLIDGRRVLACLTLATRCQSQEIITIEGLSGSEGELHPMQAAFIENDAFQCGYCTPGQILSAVALVHEGRLGSDNEIREHMSGNICRCAAYPNIVAAFREGAKAMVR
jgi:xanthine dehydrogenase YagT iron-sulfur-binding subunit